MGDDDARLNSTGQQAVQKLIRSLPEDSLSMAWRSSLNEQLLTVASTQRKKRRFLWIVRPACGLSLACVFALVVMFQPRVHHSTTVPDRGIETAIMSDHHYSSVMNEVSGAGLSLNEITNDANTEDPDVDQWNESDVQGL